MVFDIQKAKAQTQEVRRKLQEMGNQPYLDALKSGREHRAQCSILLKPDVLATRSQRATNIFNDFTLLQTILDRHEETIHKRWLDKKSKQRLELIRKAWGTEMAPSHRPDFEYFFKDDKWRNENRIKVREAYMWPYINEDDLLQPRNLLWFMASRSRYPPASFAATDIQAMHSQLVSETIWSSGELPDHVMMFTGREDHSRYGELLNVSEHPDAAMWLTMGHGSFFPNGLLILEAQERTMSFLLACVHLILHDVKDLLQGPKRSAPTLTSETGTGFASLITTASRAPYLPPAQLDLDRIISL
jgi:hypothetical protein